MPMFLSEKRCLLIISAAYIQVPFSLVIMEADDLSHDQTVPRELPWTIYIGYISR